MQTASDIVTVVLVSPHRERFSDSGVAGDFQRSISGRFDSDEHSLSVSLYMRTTARLKVKQTDRG